MLDSNAALVAFEEALAREGEGIYVPPHTDRGQVEAAIRSHLCTPFQVMGKVMPPGFPFAEVGQSLSGFCIARSAGYWLVYQPEEQRFLCFWVASPESLGAHGV